MASGTRRGKASLQRKLPAGMPKTPKELEEFIRGVVNESVTRPNSPPTPEEQREHAVAEGITPAERRLLNGVLVGRELLERATEVFDDRNAALDWIFEPNSALNGKTPYDVSSEELGREQVFDILGRIEHGVIS